MKTREYNCMICSSPFIAAVNGRHYFCSEACKEENAEIKKRWKKKIKAAERAKKKEEKKKESKKETKEVVIPIGEVAKKARESGMSYGKYLAKEQAKQVKVVNRLKARAN